MVCGTSFRLCDERSARRVCVSTIFEPCVCVSVRGFDGAVLGRAADWGDPVWSGELKVVSRGSQAAIKLTGRDGVWSPLLSPTTPSCSLPHCVLCIICSATVRACAPIEVLAGRSESGSESLCWCPLNPCVGNPAGRLFAICVVKPDGPPAVEKGR